MNVQNFRHLDTRNIVPLYFEVNVWGSFVIMLIWLENWVQRLKIHKSTMPAHKLLLRQLFWNYVTNFFII